MAEELPGVCPWLCPGSVGDPLGMCPGWAAVTPPVSVGHSSADTSAARGSGSTSIPLSLRAGITEVMEMDPAPGVTVIHSDNRDGSCSGVIPCTPAGGTGVWQDGSNTQCSQKDSAGG